MVNHDQAAGLRRIMASPQPRIVSVLSVTSVAEKTRTLDNLAASLWRSGSDVMIVNAALGPRESAHQYGVASLPSLMDVAQNQSSLQDAILFSEQGYSATMLMTKKQSRRAMDATLKNRLDHLFNTLAGHYEVVLVDAELNEHDILPLNVLNQSEILIQLTSKPESIKQAYRLIKQLYQQLGRDSFGILLSGANQKIAQDIFRNLSQVAGRYLSVELELIGAVPVDEHLNKATNLGRAVVEAFPMALASTAFKEMAKRLGYQQPEYQSLGSQQTFNPALQ